MRRFEVQWTRPAVVTLGGIVAATLVFGLLAYHRRWIGDDGLIVLRTVRQILAGNGPVYNVFERAEANTSTLWTWLLVMNVGIAGGDPAVVSVVTGWLLSVGGVLVAMDATRRWHRARGSDAMLVPAGVLVVIGAFEFWDFATSGLETGLCTFWIAACWWLLVALRPETASRHQFATLVVMGLGPLVRPDFAVVSAVYFVAAWLIVRPSRRRAVALLGAAVALPVAYEIFRAGYYGTLFPLPAIAKSATAAEWGRGLAYVRDFLEPCRVWIPLVILGALFVYAVRRGSIATRDRVLIAAPVVGALLMMLFVLRVGGDFMHGRMCLPPIFTVLLPAMVLPLRLCSALALAVVAGWAIVIGISRGDGRNYATAYAVGDERSATVGWTGSQHPIATDLFVRTDRPSTEMVETAVREGRHLMISEGGLSEAANPALAAPVVFAVGRLGVGGAAAPLDGIVADTLGLANPLGARITPTNPGIIAHEKGLPWGWIRADFTDPAIDRQGEERTPVFTIKAARRAMQCGELKELLDSVREPLTARRFWNNLTGAVRRTSLVIPSDPVEAEEKFCGPRPPAPRVTATSSYEGSGWSVENLIDGQQVPSGALGYSSEVGPVQSLTIDLRRRTSVSKVVLYARRDTGSIGVGFPIDFQIQIWSGAQWLDRVTRTDYPKPGIEPQVFSWSVPDTTDRIRITATKLPDVEASGPRLQLAEIEVQ